MRGLGVWALLALAGCGGDAVRPANTQQAVQPPAKVAAPPPAAVAEPPEPADDAGLAAMSPSRRRAYERGLADCRAGRYQPANHPEAYRIGCAAAHDR